MDVNYSAPSLNTQPSTLNFCFRVNPAVIYLDYNATTPLAPEAREAMQPYLGEHFGNPSSIHAAGRAARAAADVARDRIAALLHAKPHEIIFTGGGTESDNCLLYTSPSPRDRTRSRMPSSA